MKVNAIVVDARTGKVVEQVADLAVLSEEEGIERERVKNIERSNAAIRAQLDANDLKAIRAMLDGDAERIDAIKMMQAQLRAKLVSL